MMTESSPARSRAEWMIHSQNLHESQVVTDFSGAELETVAILAACSTQGSNPRHEGSKALSL